MTAIGPRPRGLPIAPVAPPARRRLPLAEHARDVDRAHRPRYAVWELTLRCDLACRHCGSRAGKARPSELSTSEALDVVRQLAEMGTKEVTLIGGEAYLHDGWFDVASAITASGMEMTMVTGGRGITEERARQLEQAGAKAVGVSVDGLEDMHDALRGVRGAFRSAIDAIRLLRARGLRVSVNTQIARPALLQIEPLLDRLMDEGIEGWQVSMTVPMGRAADEPELLLQPYQVLEVLPLIARIETKARRRDVDVAPGNDIGYFGPYEEQLRARFHGGHRMACTAGKGTLGIEADGSVKGCPSLPTKDYVGGNLRDDDLQSIWERAETLRFARDRTEKELWGFCGDCYYGEDCLGGCTWTAHVLFGKRGNNPYCHHRALELLARGTRERIVRVEAPEGLPFDFGRFECIEEPWPSDELDRARELARTGEGFLNETLARAGASITSS
ncbi:MAG: radical SAM protein [Polyangiaceae bacterium]|nr:radical SAM protein [Polyangiaceae bacterium]